MKLELFLEDGTLLYVVYLESNSIIYQEDLKLQLIPYGIPLYAVITKTSNNVYGQVITLSYGQYVWSELS